MGLIFSRIISVFSKQITVGTQTSTKFTEKLTNFGTVEISSAETFDQACNICDLYTEREAVGFCCVCEQYMCYQCCKHHEKIILSKYHKIVGKEHFQNVRTGKQLTDMQLVPFVSGQLPNCIDNTCTQKMACCEHSYLLSHFTVGTDMYTLLYSRNYCYTEYIFELGCIKENSNYKMISKHILKHSPSTSALIAICKYFIGPNLKDIWLLHGYSGSLVFYKNAFTVTGKCYGVVRFNDGLAVCLNIETGFSLPDWQIQFVDFKGNMKKQIYYDSDGKPLFKHPQDITTNYTEDILFVSDRGNIAVIALGSKGEVIYKFTHDTLQSPTGLTCDEENNVYVACGKNVIQIDKHGQKSRVILQSESRIITNICYIKQTRRLSVIDSDKTASIFNFF